MLPLWVTTSSNDLLTQVHQEIYPFFHFKHNFFKNSFYPSARIEWKNLDKSIRNSESVNIFLKSILKLIGPSPKTMYNCFNTKGIKHLTRFRLSLSRLRYHKFKHGFLITSLSRNIPHFILNTISSKLFFVFCNNWMEQPRLRPSPNSTYNYLNTKDIKHLTRLSFGLSHLRYHKLKHGLLDLLNPSEIAVLALKQPVIFYLIAPVL